MGGAIDISVFSFVELNKNSLDSRICGNDGKMRNPDEAERNPGLSSHPTGPGVQPDGLHPGYAATQSTPTSIKIK
jgi:hypothetical protein